MIATRGAKSENRISKSETKSKFERKHKPDADSSFLASDFGFVSDFDIRNSDLRRRSSFLILKCVLAAWVLASLLFAHGCHGNEDHELFDAIAWVSGE
jgi:hypothetical protein